MPRGWQTHFSLVRLKFMIGMHQTVKVFNVGYFLFDLLDGGFGFDGGRLRDADADDTLVSESRKWMAGR